MTTIIKALIILFLSSPIMFAGMCLVAANAGKQFEQEAEAQRELAMKHPAKRMTLDDILAE